MQTMLECVQSGVFLMRFRLFSLGEHGTAFLLLVSFVLLLQIKSRDKGDNQWDPSAEPSYGPASAKNIQDKFLTLIVMMDTDCIPRLDGKEHVLIYV